MSCYRHVMPEWHSDAFLSAAFIQCRSYHAKCGVGTSHGEQPLAISLHYCESRDGSTHISKKHNELSLTAYILQSVCTMQLLLTCDVVFVCSPVEVCDTLFANEDDVGIQAQLLQLCMPLLSLQITRHSPQSTTTSGHSHRVPPRLDTQT